MGIFLGKPAVLLFLHLGCFGRRLNSLSGIKIRGSIILPLEKNFEFSEGTSFFFFFNCIPKTARSTEVFLNQNGCRE